MKITFEGCECSFSMGAISIDLDPKETEVIVNADVRKYEIGEGDLTTQVKQIITNVVKDAMGEFVNNKPIYTPPLVPTKPEPTPAQGACLKPAPAEELVEEDAIVEDVPKKKFGPKRRAQK